VFPPPFRLLDTEAAGTNNGNESMQYSIPENIYGHRKRLEWILRHVHPGQRVVELGCGTGHMITRPLLKLGYDAYGVDLDEPSIQFGRERFRREGLDPHRLLANNIDTLPFRADVVIASEILEHVLDQDMSDLMQTVRTAVCPGGKLLVTVPNGYGWFELEALLWNRFGLNRLFFWNGYYEVIKQRIFGRNCLDHTPITLADSPHVQRFTLNSIKRLVTQSGFEVRSTMGSVLFAGPPSHCLFSGIPPVMWVNRWLGSCLKPLAAGFYLECVDLREAAARAA